uniref:Uncharacterized protein n=1 Tax=Picea sitchensis TaxID=3332 RepID=D5AD49_PICSI|nr:unknown [Picea sitchensis]
MDYLSLGMIFLVLRTTFETSLSNLKSSLLRITKIFMQKKQLHKEKESANECLAFLDLLHPANYKMKCWIHNRESWEYIITI